MNQNTPYLASLTREPFMYVEMKTTASLLNQGLNEFEIIEKVLNENLFQYPTERTLERRAKACLKRLNHLDKEMIEWIENRSMEASKQICLYAFMKDSRLIYEFMLTVIGEKYETLDFSYSRNDIAKFFNRLQEQNEQIASWSDSTINKLISVLGGVLRDVGYIDTTRSKKLNKLLLDYKLKEKIIANGDAHMLPAFDCFEV
ncbi:DUF1819 family protein [Ligilactobacillus ceti]|uniref:Inner membrane protein (DUF1819) n=1 Tax=Ligilactobacillus ceti DSM 22408 TaxID=1122146 RepID=A0A0R2KRS1_9LACO|nr:DUF1819 family protein [Ligilactobacillus ceti]KRN88804.1 hypothetical protein IV53_GL000774 [Ligilactobacillus ceti DSM 22408]